MIIIQNLREGFNIVTDQEQSAYALDFIKHERFTIDDKETEYEVYPMSNSGIIDYDTMITRTRKELRAEWVKSI